MSVSLATAAKPVPPSEVSNKQNANINTVLETTPRDWLRPFFVALSVLHTNYVELEIGKVTANDLIGTPEHSYSLLLSSAVKQKIEKFSKLQQAYIGRAYGIFMTLAMHSKLPEKTLQDPAFSKMAMTFCSEVVKTGPNPN